MNIGEQMKRAGFELTDTGGGVEQFLRHRPDGSYLIITDADGEAPTSATEPCSLGIYSAEGDQLRFETYPTLVEALAACD